MNPPFLLVLAIGIGAPTIGVCCTLTHPAYDHPRFAWMVYAGGGIWTFLVWRLYRWLSGEARLPKIGRLWMGAAARGPVPHLGVTWGMLALVLPYCSMFALTLWNTPKFREEWKYVVRPAAEKPGRQVAAAGPAQNALSANEVKMLAVRIWPRFADHTMKVMNSIPAAWCVFVFVVAFARGK